MTHRTPPSHPTTPLFESLEHRRLLSAAPHAALLSHPTRAKQALNLVGTYAGTSTVRGLGRDAFTLNVIDQNLIGQISGSLVGNIDHTPAAFSGVFSKRRINIFWTEAGVQLHATGKVSNDGARITGNFSGVLAGKLVKAKFDVTRPSAPPPETTGTV